MRVLIVDDEPLARSALASLLSERADIDEFQVAQDAHEALERLSANPFDVLLLDIQMPTLTGLQMIEQLSQHSSPKPSVVFITAYAEHAVRLLDMMSSGLKMRPERSPRVAVRDKSRIVFVDLAELISAEAQGNYVLLHQKSGSYLLRETLSRLAEKLGSHGFIRIHRSVLVNTAFVETIEPGVGSEYVLRTRNGKQYNVTRTFRDNLKGLAQFWIGTDGFGPG